MQVHLQNPFINVSFSDMLYYGGNQNISDDSSIRRCGCGLISVLDSIIYYSRSTQEVNCSLFLKEYGIPADVFQTIPGDLYNRALKDLLKKYFLMIYPVGITGFSLSAGFNRLTRDYGIPLHSVWSVRRKNIMRDIELMLGKEIPVIISIGRRIELSRQNKGLIMREESFLPYVKRCGAAYVKSHYVTVTGIEGTSMIVSSWGRKFRLPVEDYLTYANNPLDSLLSNILYIYNTKEKKV